MADDPIIFADADEARAWDGYAAAVLPLDHVHAWARVAEWADAMLRERRKRMRLHTQAIPVQPITPRCDAKLGWTEVDALGYRARIRCGRPKNHEGKCHP